MIKYTFSKEYGLTRPFQRCHMCIIALQISGDSNICSKAVKLYKLTTKKTQSSTLLGLCKRNQWQIDPVTKGLHIESLSVWWHPRDRLIAETIPSPSLHTVPSSISMDCEAILHHNINGHMELPCINHTIGQLLLPMLIRLDNYPLYYINPIRL